MTIVGEIYFFCKPDCKEAKRESGIDLFWGKGVRKLKRGGNLIKEGRGRRGR